MAIDYFPGLDAPEPALERPRASGKAGLFGKNGFDFFDFLDIINPLQHIPFVANIYRKITGDEIAPGARLIGGGIFGGPIGFAAAVANVAVESASGRDMGGHVLAMLTGDGEAKDLARESQ